ncbi:MAG: carboxylating nicotinate-nucleotide diphosphorylase [Candidatus Omnitrophica bacterium]|nr:carboxylating nicotinate-nucleotide diphosphorylase [Candidatus Omnitrophota bacterium]
MVINREVKQIIQRAIEEDLGKRDITTFYLVDPAIKIKAKIIAKEDLVLCGLDVCRQTFKQVDNGVKFRTVRKEGSLVKKGQVLAALEGRAFSIIKAERVALNFLMHLSGIASKTRKFVNIAAKYKVKVLDTRKTIPMLRVLQKSAVKAAGGFNHRKGLWDEVIIKENHLKACGINIHDNRFEESLRNIIKNIKKATAKRVEVEVETFQEFKVACRCRPDVILLDNFTPKKARKAVQLRNKYFPGIKLEASGGINLGNIEKFAKTRVDYISIGSLTHSVQTKDMSLEIARA